MKPTVLENRKTYIFRSSGITVPATASSLESALIQVQKTDPAITLNDLVEEKDGHITDQREGRRLTGENNKKIAPRDGRKLTGPSNPTNVVGAAPRIPDREGRRADWFKS